MIKSSKEEIESYFKKRPCDIIHTTIMDLKNKVALLEALEKVNSKKNTTHSVLSMNTILEDICLLTINAKREISTSFEEKT